MNIKEAIEHLESYDLKTDCAFHLWLPDDVKGIAEDEEIKLNNEEVGMILDNIHQHTDSELGITWETIRCGVCDFDQERGGE